MTKIISYVGCILLLISFPNHASGYHKSLERLRKNIHATTTAFGAKIGMAMMGLDFKDSLTINNEHCYPMQSVYKFPLAIAILHGVDQRQHSLDEKFHILRESLDTHTWSPMVKDFPHQAFDVTLRDLLIYTISKSDNNACDILFRLAGGTASVNSYIHRLGISNMMIAATEAEMCRQWQIQYTNWCQPASMVQLLQQFYHGKLLSKSSNDFLMKIMTESENSPKRIKGLLPEHAIVAHKTGTSNTNKKGITAATNDAGIITLPNGKHVALVVYISDYKTGVANGEQVIARIAKLVWDYYSEK